MGADNCRSQADGMTKEYVGKALQVRIMAERQLALLMEEHAAQQKLGRRQQRTAEVANDPGCKEAFLFLTWAPMNSWTIFAVIWFCPLVPG